MHFNSIYYHTWNKARAEQSKNLKVFIADLADQFVQKYAAEIVLIAMESMDYQPCVDVSGLMHAPSFIIDADRYTAEEMATALRSLDFLVTTRFHTAVLSMETGVPFVALSHDERLQFLVEEINPNQPIYYDYRSLHSEEGRLAFLDTVKQTYENPDQLSSRLKTLQLALSEKSARNELYFTQFLKERFPDLLREEIVEPALELPASPVPTAVSQ